jgi:hypothetical protein
MTQRTHLTHQGPSSVPRIGEPWPANITVDEVIQQDREFFTDNPELNEYIRPYCPGEFGAVELPIPPRGFEHATHVSVTARINGEPLLRYRRLMFVCEDINEVRAP